jgi:hypothetical protein
MIVAATRNVNFSLRRTDPSPAELLLEFSSTAAAIDAPSGNLLSVRCGTPKSCGTAICWLADRDLSEEFEISALSSISMTTVKISPRCIARRSPKSDARSRVHSDARADRGRLTNAISSVNE